MAQVDFYLKAVIEWLLPKIMCFNFSRVNLESALGVIGGTMGLFTGFSVLSAVEIVYYALKYLPSLPECRKDQQELKSSVQMIFGWSLRWFSQFFSD